MEWKEWSTDRRNRAGRSNQAWSQSVLGCVLKRVGLQLLQPCQKEEERENPKKKRERERERGIFVLRQRQAATIDLVGRRRPQSSAVLLFLVFFYFFFFFFFLFLLQSESDGREKCLSAAADPQ